MISECPKCQATTDPAKTALKTFNNSGSTYHCDYDPNSECYIIMGRGDYSRFNEVRAFVQGTSLQQKARQRTAQAYREELMQEMFNNDPTMPFVEARAIIERKVEEMKRAMEKQ